MLTAVIPAIVAAVVLAAVCLVAAGIRRGRKELARIIAAHRLDEAMRQSEKNRSDEEVQ